MRYATVLVDGRSFAAEQQGDIFELLDAADVGDLLRRRAETVQRLGQRASDEVVLAPVVTSARKIVCLGLNYLTHLREIHKNAEIPRFPTLFSKFYDTVCGPLDDVAIPEAELAATIDWEVELAVVVGKTIHRADEAQAEAAIAGFTIANDISMRDWQNRTGQWLQGKAWDCTTPLGPVLVTADEIGTKPSLDIACSVNGVVKQAANTGDLFYGPARALSYISTFTTLRPGDIVLTGTPGGVGLATGERTLLRPGDEVVSRIEGIGELRNRIVREPDSEA